ncbi:MAG: NUDIX domain-containing protein [Alphaproteobacteria bacterium]
MLYNDISCTLDLYAARFPDETRDVATLRQLIAEGGNVSSRHEFRGHITSGAIMVNEAGKLLMIHHRVLERWLFPGGHLESTDATLRDAAIREAEEETGIPPQKLHSFEGWPQGTPIYFDAHVIPENTANNEPEHRHFGFVYLFRVLPQQITLQLEEVTNWAWGETKDAPEVIGARLRRLGLS